jgi:predicted ATPase
MIVLTGGPGSGKSSLVNGLQALGFHCAPESGRIILQSEGGMALRAASPEKYAAAMLRIDREKCNSAVNVSTKTVLVRGLPDIVGYLNLMNCNIPEDLHLACQKMRYSGPIFSAPPWQEIYVQDSERTQDFDTACATHDAVCSAWKNYGYQLVELPKMTIDDRIKFILNRAT